MAKNYNERQNFMVSESIYIFYTGYLIRNSKEKHYFKSL